MASSRAAPVGNINLLHLKVWLLEARRNAENRGERVAIDRVLRDAEGGKISKRVRRLCNDLAKEQRETEAVSAS